MPPNPSSAVHDTGLPGTKCFVAAPTSAPLQPPLTADALNHVFLLNSAYRLTPHWSDLHRQYRSASTANTRLIDLAQPIHSITGNLHTATTTTIDRDQLPPGPKLTKRYYNYLLPTYQPPINFMNLRRHLRQRWPTHRHPVPTLHRILRLLRQTPHPERPPLAVYSHSPQRAAHTPTIPTPPPVCALPSRRRHPGTLLPLSPSPCPLRTHFQRPTMVRPPTPDRQPHTTPTTTPTPTPAQLLQPYQL